MNPSLNEITLFYLTDLEKIPALQQIQIDKHLSIPTADPNYVLQPMTMEEFQDPVVLWQNVIQTIHGEPAIYMDDPHGWYLGYRNNELIGSCASLKKAHKTAWLGYYYVQEQFRGKGYGKLMFETILKNDYKMGIENHTLICLDSLVPMYNSIGFQAYTYDVIFQSNLENSLISKINILPLTMSPQLFNSLVDYDKNIQYGLDRKNFLNLWLNKKETHVIIAMKHDKIVGYNVISDFKYPNDNNIVNQRMAPLYADDAKIAESLIVAGLQLKSKPLMYIDADGSNPEAIKLIHKLGSFTQIAQLARMSFPKIPEYYDTSKVFSPTFYGNGP